jgi:hypothetical protein
LSISPKKKGNGEAAGKFNVGETSVREWRKEEAAIKCLHQKKRAFGDTSTPEMGHEESTSENELSDVPEEIINALHSLDCDSYEEFVGFE